MCMQYVVSQKHMNDCVALLEVQASWDYTLTETGEWLYTFIPGNIIWLCTIADLDDGVPEQASRDGLLALTYSAEEIEEHHASGDNMGMSLEGGKGQGKAKGKSQREMPREEPREMPWERQRAKENKATKGQAKAKAQSKGKGKGLQDEYDGGDESDSHPNEDNIPDSEDFTDMGKGRGASKGTAKGQGK